MSDKEPAESLQIYAGLSTPVVIIDADYSIVYLNPSAETFWQTTLHEVAGQYPFSGLRLAPPNHRDLRDWAREVFFPAVAAGDPFECLVAGAGGREQIIRLSGTRFHEDGEWYTLLTVLCESQPESAPAWALTDPLTGLHNRHQWDREFPERNARAGCVFLFDMDDLKEINDLNGHRQGDQALIIAGQAIQEHTPEGALAVRYGGDEFLLIVDRWAEGAASALAERIVASAAARAADFEHPLHLSWGLAEFEAGGLASAVERADEAMYERRGVLLRGILGGRIILTRGGRNGVLLRPLEDVEPAVPGAFASGFGAEFDAQFRQAFARATQQARRIRRIRGTATRGGHRRGGSRLRPHRLRWRFGRPDRSTRATAAHRSVPCPTWGGT